MKRKTRPAQLCRAGFYQAVRTLSSDDGHRCALAYAGIRRSDADIGFLFRRSRRDRKDLRYRAGWNQNSCRNLRPSRIASSEGNDDTAGRCRPAESYGSGDALSAGNTRRI